MPSPHRDVQRSGDHFASRSDAAADARQRILAAARAQFADRGFEQVSLQDVALQVGLTRGAVLYHFGSKVELMSALVQPYIDQLDEALLKLEKADPPPRPRTVLAATLDPLLVHRPAAELMTRDVSGRHALDLEEWMRTTVRRLVVLLDPDPDDPTIEIRGLAALGALVRPLASLPDPLPDGARDVILSAAVNAFRPQRRR